MLNAIGAADAATQLAIDRQSIVPTQRGLAGGTSSRKVGDVLLILSRNPEPLTVMSHLRLALREPPFRPR
jgi:hypothetical protein